MAWLALAVFLVGLMFVAVLFALGRRFIDLYARHEAIPEASTPEAMLPPDPTDPDDEELTSFVRYGQDSIASQQFDEWVEERRADGLTDAEINQELRERQPLVVM